ncbi:MAG: amidohydrolase [Arenimonas sp.]|nr:amidohydrolase [Arenimonas sp.]
MTFARTALSLALVIACGPAVAQQHFAPDIAKVEPKVVEWRRDIHQHPELGNRETRTAALVAAHLKALGIETTTGVAHTGVVGVLVGGKPGPVVALRADMDGLPLTERAALPFASKVRTQYNGAEVGVMHACGHDTHVAILMGVAEVLAANRAQIPGTVKFIFQPAEEGPPLGEDGGAKLMQEQGVLESPDVDAVFGLHIDAFREVGSIGYKPGGTMASSDSFRITVNGKGSHGAYPWSGADPVVASAHIITALQTIVSRNVDLTEAAAVVSVGSIHGGNRPNIIPEQIEMLGTLRALTPEARELLRTRLVDVATKVGDSLGTQVKVEVPLGMAYPVTYNDEALTARMLPSLQVAAGADRVELEVAATGAEDFAYFAEKVPGLYFTIGGRPANVPESATADHHTPDFTVDDSRLDVGVRAMVQLAMDYLSNPPAANQP